jgi:hypothetical protein
MSVKKIIQGIHRIASDMDAAGQTELADACDSIAEEMIVSIAKETKVKTTTWRAGPGSSKGNAKTHTTSMNPSKIRPRLSGPAGLAGSIVGGIAGSVVGGQSGSSHSEQEWNAEIGSGIGQAVGEVGAKELAKRVLLGPGASTLRGIVSQTPAVAGAAVGSMIGQHVGYELGGDAGSVAGSFGGMAAGAKATQLAGAALTAAKGTLAGAGAAGAAGAAGVVLAGALGVAVGTLLVKAFPSLGSLGADWVQKAIGTHDEALTDQIWGWLETAMNSQNPDDIIRNLGKAQLGLDMYEKEYAGELNRKELDGVANMMNAIGAVRGALPQEMQDLFDQRSAKMGRTLRRKK